MTNETDIQELRGAEWMRDNPRCHRCGHRHPRGIAGEARNCYLPPDAWYRDGDLGGPSQPRCGQCGHWQDTPEHWIGRTTFTHLFTGTA